MRYICLFFTLIPLAVSQAQYPQVELYQTTQDYYYYPVGTSYGFDYLAGRHLIEGRTFPGQPSWRLLCYNFVELDGDSLGWVWITDVGMHQDMESLHIFPGNRAAVSFRDYGFEGYQSMVAVDMVRGFGIFISWLAPGYVIDSDLYRPVITDNNSGRFHMIYFSDGFQAHRFHYLSWFESEYPFGPVIVDDAVLPVAKLVTSRTSDRVALVFLKAIIEDNDQILGGDVSYVVSEDGEEWDFENDIVHVTGYQGTNLRAFGDIDALFDIEDNLQIVWNELILDDSGIPTYNGRLKHFSQQVGEINTIAENIDDEWDALPGNENIGIGNMSLACNESGHLYVVWEEFRDIDASDDGFCNGDLYMSYSFDYGDFWTQPENLTDSQAPNCQAGDCESDIFPDLDETIDDEIRLFYLSDRDAGSYEFGEGEITANIAYMMTISPRIDIGAFERPQRIFLMETYPNPFNAGTTIRFSLMEQTEIKLEVFDIAGRLVEVLADGEYSAEENRIVWDAKNKSSGIYFAKLSGKKGSISRKLVLIR